MDKKTKYHLLLIAFGITLYAVLMNVGTVLLFIQKIISLVFPILLGLVFAFILNVPMAGFEKLSVRMMAKTKYNPQYKPRTSLVSGVSLALTLLSIVLVVALALTMVIPEMINSAKSVTPLVTEQLPKWVEYLKSYNIDISRFSDLLTDFDVQKITGNAGSVFNSAISAASSTISGISSVVFGLIIAIYILMSKRLLALQTKKLMDAYLEPKITNKIIYVSALIRDTYAKFLSGQCVEAIILGALIFVSYMIFGLPYAGLIGFLTSLLAFIPYIGALAACLIGAFLILLAAPSKVLIGIAVFLVVQFIENQFIYPRVVGTSVGLSPLWTLIAALLGGNLFGLTGIIFFIPLFAAFYSLLRENTNKKLAEKAALENIENDISIKRSIE